MGKVILVLITIGILAVSAAHTYARPGEGPPAQGQAADTAPLAANSTAHALLGSVERIPAAVRRALSAPAESAHNSCGSFTGVGA